LTFGDEKGGSVKTNEAVLSDSHRNRHRKQQKENAFLKKDERKLN